MRVVHVVKGLAWTGGVQEYVSGLARGLTEQGHEVVLLTGGNPPPGGPPPHRLARELDIRYHKKIRLLGRFTWLRGLYGSLRELRNWADVVHVHQPFFVGSWIPAIMRTPVATTLYLHPDAIDGRSGRRALLKALLKRTNLLVAVSSAERELAATVKRSRNSVVVWPGIERPDHSTSTSPERLVLAVGRLSREKGADRLFEAVTHLPSDIEVAVVGEGEGEARCRTICRSGGRDPDQVFRGSASDDEILELMDQAAVFVSLSEGESFGISVLRSIAYGCVPVVSAIDSHREILRGTGDHGGLLVEPHHEPAVIAQMIETAMTTGLSSPRLRHRVPDWSAAAEQLASGYSTIVPSNPRYRDSSGT